jgi:hypothetical protein
VLECPAPARLSHCSLGGAQEAQETDLERLARENGTGRWSREKYGPPGASGQCLWVLTACACSHRPESLDPERRGARNPKTTLLDAVRRKRGHCPVSLPIGRQTTPTATSESGRSGSGVAISAAALADGDAPFSRGRAGQANARTSHFHNKDVQDRSCPPKGKLVECGAFHLRRPPWVGGHPCGAISYMRGISTQSRR